MSRPFRSLLVANRGEIACRVLRSARAIGLRTVAVYSDADAEGFHPTLADASVRIGPAKAADSYLRIDAILQAAAETGADAVHPGYGFLAESEHFAQAVQDAGLVWVGPDPQSIADMGDKERARQLAMSAAVPVLPGSRRFAPRGLDGLIEAADKVGYPLLVKASAGGGGIGMRLIEHPSELLQTVESTQCMAARAFGDGTVFLERFVRRARHVEVQVFGFGDGHAVHCFERECSIQRRFQKIVEESPSPRLDAPTRSAITEAAVALVRRQQYRGAGTIEFIVDDETGDFFFLEMNTRIQVEHPVTEARTGLDLVAMQLRLAMGELSSSSLRQDDVQPSGHAIEVRICAENPDRGFLPSPGRLTRLRWPESQAALRIDTGVREGDIVSPHYDSLVAKLIVFAPDRDGAISTLGGALAEIQIEGVTTNLPFLRRVIEHPAFQAGDTLTGFVNIHKADLIG